MRQRVNYKRVVRHDHPRTDGQGHVLEHIVIAERALGRYLPSGAEVHHVDENTSNNANANLVICQDKAYHKLLHYRARVVAAGGNPNTEKICNDCIQIKPLAAFNISRANKSSGRQSVCRSCQHKRWERRAA